MFENILIMLGIDPPRLAGLGTPPKRGLFYAFLILKS
jgi:hypothetical protein